MLLLAGRKPEALDVLRRASDDLALAGQVGQAIAVLKKIEAFDPGREDIEERLAYLVQRREKPASDPWTGRADAPAPDGDEIGFEPSDRSEPVPPAEPAAAAPVEAPGPEAEVPVSEDAFRGELLALIEGAFPPLSDAAPGPAAAGPPPHEDERVLDFPLFRSFSRDELVELIRGLRLLTFEAGEIVVSEGERGASLFLVTSGMVRAYVRNAGQKQVQVRQLGEGDFFGEISVLTGRPRSATVTAAGRCELLELDKPTLDRIAETHPHARQVMEDFHEQRAHNTLETMIRTMGLSEGVDRPPR